MFHNFPLWATILILLLALAAIFMIPLYDYIARLRNPIKIASRQFIRFDGLVATDLALTNRSKNEITITEIGFKREKSHVAQESNLMLKIQPKETLFITYISGETNWYAQ